MKESRIPFWELHGEVCELKSAQREAGQRKRRKNTKKIFAKWKCFILASKSVQNSQQTPNVEKDVKKWDFNKIRWDRRGIILGSSAQNTSASQHRHRGVSGSFETFEQFKIVPLHFGTLMPVFRHLQLMINIECFLWNYVIFSWPCGSLCGLQCIQQLSHRPVERCSLQQSGKIGRFKADCCEEVIKKWAAQQQLKLRCLSLHFI